MNVALKEWGAVVEALGRGLQILLLRKGGIVEARRGFELRRQEFLLFPAFEHQHARFIRAEHQDLMQPPGSPGPGSPGELRLEWVAKVTDIAQAPAVDVLDAAAAQYIWNRDYLRQRYEYRPDLPLYVVALRVYRLPRVAAIPDRPSYAGCKSWVNLTEEIDTGGAEPVLSDGQFAAARRAVEECLAVRRAG